MIMVPRHIEDALPNAEQSHEEGLEESWIRRTTC